MKKIITGCLTALLFGAVLLGIGVFALYKSAPDRFNILVVGTDQRADERSRSDVLMVFSIPKNPKRQTTLLTIPRDTYVNIPEYGNDKITHSYVYGDAKDGKLGNIELTKVTVEGFLDANMHATLEYNFDSFSEIIEALGGVTIDGKKLDGEEALLAVRNRYRDGGDFARTEDQREVFQAVLSEAKSPNKARALLGYMQTSENARLEYSTINAVWFGAAFYMRSFGDISLGEVVEEVVPGAGDRIYTQQFGKELYYWVPDEDALEEILVRGVR